jgi:hypothetical protein
MHVLFHFSHVVACLDWRIRSWRIAVFPTRPSTVAHRGTLLPGVRVLGMRLLEGPSLNIRTSHAGQIKSR